MKPKHFLYFLLFVGLLCAGALLYYFGTPFWQKQHERHYKGFGIHLPQSYAVHGIDVSHYQGNINWSLVAAMKHQQQQIDFAFIRASDGLNIPDRYFQRNWREAKKAGLKRGAYFYFRPNMSPIAQAELFAMQVSQLDSGDFLPVVDIEQEHGASPKVLKQNLQRCLDHLEHRFGVKPMIYSNVDFYQRHLQEQFSAYPLWIAHYHHGENPRIGCDWHFWQHSDKGCVDGIDHPVDFNVFNGSRDELQRFCIRP